jgi:hypothetical protein
MPQDKLNMKQLKCTAANERFHASGGVCPLTILWEFASASPARTFVSPRLREAAATLVATEPSEQPLEKTTKYNLKTYEIMNTKIKIALFVFLFSMLSNFTYATDSLRAYYATVAKAEWALCESDFSKAANLYRKAFSYKEKPFGLDLFRALDCELQLNVLDTATCEHYFEQILQKRVWGAFEEKHNDNFINRHKSGRLGESFGKLIDRYFSLDTTALQHQLIWMNNEDQRVRRESPGWPDICDDGNECNKKVMYVDSINRVKLFELVRTNPEILDENVVGSSGISAIELILNHQRTIGFDVDVNAYFLQAVRNGIFDARRYAKIFDIFYVFGNNDTAIPGVHMSDYYGTWNYYNYVSENKGLSIILTDERNRAVKNSRRSEIFLEDILDFSYRINCKYKQGIFTETWHVDDSEIDDRLDRFKRFNIEFDYYIPNEKDFDLYKKFAEQ